jgi:Ca2+-transporting ATPase
LITVAVLGAFGLSFAWLGKGTPAAVTISFLTLAFAQLWHVFNIRAKNSHLIKNEIVQNGYIWGALLLCSLLLVVAIYIPGLANILKVTNPGIDGWGLVIGGSLLPLIAGQVLKAVEIPLPGFVDNRSAKN